MFSVVNKKLKLCLIMESNAGTGNAGFVAPRHAALALCARAEPDLPLPALGDDAARSRSFTCTTSNQGVQSVD